MVTDPPAGIAPLPATFLAVTWLAEGWSVASP